MSVSPTRAAVAAVAAALSLTSLVACSSSGSDTKPAQAEVAAQLKKDKTFGPLIKTLPAGKQDSVANCIAGAMEKGLTAGELNDFVSGAKSAKDIHDTSKPATEAGNEALACAQKAGYKTP